MFIPIRDDVPTVRTPYVTIGLIVLNSIIFLFSLMLGSRGFELFTLKYGYIPWEMVHQAELYESIHAPIFLTPFSSMFMHAGWMHIIGNMLFLWIFGNNVEDYFGPVKFLLFYIVSGLSAIFLFTLFGPNSKVPLVGASGAIAGVMGAYYVLHPRGRITVLFFLFFIIQFLVLPAKIVLGFWFALQLFMALMGSSSGGGVAWLAHVGGFLFGWGLLRLLVKWRGPRAIAGGGDNQQIYRVHWD